MMPTAPSPDPSMQWQTAWIALIIALQRVEVVPSPYLEDTLIFLFAMVSNGDGSLLPKFGVYATLASIDGNDYPGVTNEIKNVVDVCCHTLLPFCTQCDRLILIPSAIHTASSSPARCNSRQTFSQLSRVGRSSAVRMISVNP